MSEKLLKQIAADLLETVKTCYRFPGSAKANGAARETLQQYGVIDQHGVFRNVDCFTVIEETVSEHANYARTGK